jgi:hypothetical protein
MAKNVHRVNKAQWEKWNKQEQAAYNRMWQRLNPLPEEYMARPIPAILRHNICWDVAEMMKEWRGNWA